MDGLMLHLIIFVIGASVGACVAVVAFAAVVAGARADALERGEAGR